MGGNAEDLFGSMVVVEGLSMESNERAMHLFMLTAVFVWAWMARRRGAS
jgi:hypothetical protein